MFNYDIESALFQRVAKQLLRKNNNSNLIVALTLHNDFEEFI